MDGHYLNLAAFQRCTQALGPGKRAAIWVQGCPFNCPGCIAPGWIAARPAQLISSLHLAELVSRLKCIQGLTISGGEPMLQAEALLDLLRRVKAVRPVDVICFTGFRLETLLESPPVPAVRGFLNELDVLVDGPYIRRLNNDLGLRGSTNQRVHHLTGTLRAYDFEHMPRRVEIRLQGQDSFLVGVPHKATLAAYDRALRRSEPFKQAVSCQGGNP